jgi:hypothetical protein
VTWITVGSVADPARLLVEIEDFRESPLFRGFPVVRPALVIVVISSSIVFIAVPVIIIIATGFIAIVHIAGSMVVVVPGTISIIAIVIPVSLITRSIVIETATIVVVAGAIVPVVLISGTFVPADHGRNAIQQRAFPGWGMTSLLLVSFEQLKYLVEHLGSPF